MGLVFLAEDIALGRQVALKVMRPELASQARARERFLREARAMAAVKHDHLATIHQVGEDNGVPFLAMELLAGESLDSRLEREGALPIAEVLRIGCQITQGLGAIHAGRVVHRDLKPANIWLEGEGRRVKILDFGLTTWMTGGKSFNRGDTNTSWQTGNDCPDGHLSTRTGRFGFLQAGQAGRSRPLGSTGGFRRGPPAYGDLLAL
jgi:serine/threonine protein kinase